MVQVQERGEEHRGPLCCAFQVGGLKVTSMAITSLELHLLVLPKPYDEWDFGKLKKTSFGKREYHPHLFPLAEGKWRQPRHHFLWGACLPVAPKSHCRFNKLSRLMCGALNVKKPL